MKKNTIDNDLLKRWSFKRHLHDVVREAKKKKKLSKTNEQHYNSDVIDMLARSIDYSVNYVRKNKLKLNVCNNFSIIDNPKHSLEVILSFARDIRLAAPKEVVFNHSNVTNIDLSAESILGCIAGEVRKEQASKRHKIKASGNYPDKEESVKLIKSIGVIRNLNVKHEFLRNEESATLRVFKRRNRAIIKNVIYNASDYKERSVTAFVDHINKCLLDHDRTLKPEAVGKLVAYTGEILTNAEDHPRYSDWTIIGYLDNTTEKHYCEITIFNFGETISGTLAKLPRDSFTYKQIAPYIAAHTKKGFFKKEWKEEDLYTLVALQGNISSKNKSAEDHRGQGTVDLIQFFQQINIECGGKSTEKAKMAILSGSTYILFDGAYRMDADKSGRSIIAFNKDNDLNEKPDQNYVKNLGDIKFPGTIIAIKFPMQINEQTNEVKAYEEQ